MNFQDDCFYAGSDKWLEDFCARMKKEVGLPFIARMIPRYVTPERIALLKSGGLEYVTMGLEASDRLNKQIFNRKETAKSFVKAARTILAAGLHLSVDVLIHNAGINLTGRFADLIGAASTGYRVPQAIQERLEHHRGDGEPATQ